MRFNQFILGLLFIIIGPTVMNAQTIKGVVTDENGQALPYSNVVDKATANGVTTDGNGNFEIRVTGLPVN
jgi:iron complex outermembrane receptor protein